MTLGVCNKLAISWPPQHYKTWSTTVRYPLWRMLRTPGLRVGVGTYNQRYANKVSRWTRRLAERVGLSPSGAVDSWELPNGSTYIARGAGVGLSGEPVDLWCCDDPFKNRESADSPVVQEKVWEWHMDDVTPRIQQGGAYILIHCIMEGMRVLREDGRWVAIEQIRPGDGVVSLSVGGGRLVSARVTATKMSGWDETLRVSTDRLSLSVNRRHPFAVLRRGKARFDPYDVEWVPAGDLRLGDVVVTAKSLPADYSPDDKLPDGRSVSEDVAWFLGFMLGDGWVSSVRRGQRSRTYAVCVAVGQSPCEAKAGLEDRVRAAFESFSANKVYTTSGGYLRSDWTAGGRMLHGMGYGAGAKGKRVPDAVWRWSPHLRRAFLRGYADADGTMQHESERGGGQTWRIGSVNRQLLQDARDLALTCGVRPTTVFTDKPRRQQPPNSPKPVVSVIHSLGLSFLSHMAEGRSRLLRDHPAPEYLRYERVRAITPGVIAPVYDLTVEGTESFVAEGFVVHNTRWNPGDLIGRIQSSEDAANWRYVRLPAVAETQEERDAVNGRQGLPVGGADPLGRAPGAPLCPGAFDAESLASKRVTLGVGFESLYQQNPVPRGGSFFDRSWFAVVSEPPEGCAWERYWDLAASRADSACYTSGVLMGRCGSGAASRYYVGDVVRGRWEPATRNEIMLRTARADATRVGFRRTWFEKPVFDKDGSASRAVVAALAGFPVSPDNVSRSGSKEIRAEPLAGAAKAGLVALVAGSWTAAYLTEIEAFPRGQFKDQVDSSSGCFNKLSRPAGGWSLGGEGGSLYGG